MTDLNDNGIPDKGEVSFHLKSFIVGAVLALALGSSSIGLAKSLFPESETIRNVGRWFAGAADNEARKELERYKEAWACIEGGAAIQGTDISICSAKLGADDDN